MKGLENNPGAIDDLVIENSPCKKDNFHCTFDLGFCGWKNFYFKRQTFEMNNYFISSGKYFIRTDRNASLGLPFFDLPSHHTFCLRFFYAISGKARLVVFPRFSNKNIRGSALFDVNSIRYPIRTGKWFKFERTIPLSVGNPNYKVQLIFKVTTQGINSSVSIDDITFFTNVCMNGIFLFLLLNILLIIRNSSLFVFDNRYKVNINTKISVL